MFGAVQVQCSVWGTPGTGHQDTHNQDWFLVASFMLLQCCRATQSAVRSVPACSSMEAAVRKISWNLVRLM